MPVSAAEPREYKLIHNAADAALPAVERDFIELMTQIQGNIAIAELAEAIRSGGNVPRLIPFDMLPDGLTAVFDDPIRDIIAAVGTGTVGSLPNAAGLMSFDLLNPRSVNWIAANAAARVTNIDEDARAAIRAILRRSFIDGLPPLNNIGLGSAELIYTVIGLTERQAMAVFNYNTRLINDGSASSARIDKLVSDYAERLLRHRSLMIARTETIDAANFGQLEGWFQAADRGFLDPARTMRAWVVTPDDRLCPRCGKMKGVRVPFYDPFDERNKSGDRVQALMAPTLHPGCRCTTRLVFV